MAPPGRSCDLRRRGSAGLPPCAPLGEGPGERSAGGNHLSLAGLSPDTAPQPDTLVLNFQLLEL